MQKNSDNFSIQEAQRLLQTPQGQQLLALFRSQDAGTMQQAADAATSGDYNRAQQLLSHLFADPRLQDLLSQLGR